MNTQALPIRPSNAPTAPSRADCVCRSAFSLLELTIVLAIIVATSAVALPRYWSSIGRYRVDLASRRLASDIAMAQSHARTTGSFRNVVFSPGSATYVLSEESAVNGGPGAYTINLASDPYLVSFATITATDSGRRVTFDGFGQPAQGIAIAITCAGHQRTVRVDQTSGSINVTTP